MILIERDVSVFKKFDKFFDLKKSFFAKWILKITISHKNWVLFGTIKNDIFSWNFFYFELFSFLLKCIYQKKAKS